MISINLFMLVTTILCALSVSVGVYLGSNWKIK